MKKSTALIFILNCAVIANAQPTITNFSPASGPIGTIDTIYGTNFHTTADSNIVYYGATKATVNAATSTRLILTVPPGATPEPITVETGGLIAYSSKPFLVTFVKGANAPLNAFSFFSTGWATVGIYIKQLAISDLNLDGKPDLVFSDKLNDVTILRTKFNGTVAYENLNGFAADNFPGVLAIGDFNGDGKPDVAVAIEGSGKVNVYMNTTTTQNATFQQGPLLVCNTIPKSIAVHDFNGDGLPDIVTVDQADNKLSVFRNTSTSPAVSFAARLNLATGANPTGIAVADLTGDGKPDLAVVNVGDSTVSLYRNTSSGSTISFANKVDIQALRSPQKISIADLDGDGINDLAVTSTYYGKVSIFRNQGSGSSFSFATRLDYIIGSQVDTRAQDVAIGDLDGDAKPDLAVSNYATTGHIAILKNLCSSGNISFASRIEYGVGQNPMDLAIGDLNGDGKNDIAITYQANGATSSISVLLNRVCLPDAQIAYSGFTSFCQGKSLTLQTDTGAGLSWQWRKNSVDIPGAVSSSFTATTSGSYKAFITNSIGCSDTTSAVSVIAKPLPAIGSISGATASHPNDTNTYSVTAQTGFVYAWSVTNGIIQSGQGTNSLKVKWTATGSGNVKLVVTNSASCKDSVTLAVSLISTGLQKKAEGHFTIYPNPAKNELIITAEQNLQGSQCIVSDVAGRRAFESTVLTDADKHTLQLGELRAGVYILHIQTGDSVRWLKFVKE